MFLYPTVLFGVGMSQPLRSVTFGPRQRPSSFMSEQHSLPVARQASSTVVYCIPHAVATVTAGAAAAVAVAVAAVPTRNNTAAFIAGARRAPRRTMSMAAVDSAKDFYGPRKRLGSTRFVLMLFLMKTKWWG